MSITSEARRWFLSHYGESKNKTYSSKYYLPEESWPKKHVWWIQIPSYAIDPKSYDYVNILCQVAPLKNDFHYLSVPVNYLLEHFKKFHKIDGKMDMYLSADPDTLFMEIRGEGHLDFSKFVIPAKA